ncbi:MAG: hypothetical protein OEW75_18975, partial [Cyclobacteriaceae bacterium]|nr:hypothetical protein [Cyclobacteriaceae bacterium]
RAFSHGCIRIEKANELAFLLTQNQSLLDYNKYKEFDENEHIKLKSPVPLYINYWTSWYQDSDIVFLDDIYNKDQYLIKFFFQKPSFF